MSRKGCCAKNRRVPRLKVTRDKAGTLRWALLSPNNHVLVSSPGSYARRRDAIMGFCRVLEAICCVVDEIHALRATKERRNAKCQKGTANATEEGRRIAGGTPAPPR